MEPTIAWHNPSLAPSVGALFLQNRLRGPLLLKKKKVFCVSQTLLSTTTHWYKLLVGTPIRGALLNPWPSCSTESDCPR